MSATKRKIPGIVKTSFFTLITIVVWIAFEVIKIFMTKPPPSVPAEILSPIDPTLDTTVLGKLEQRVYISDEEIGNIKVATPTATPAIAPTATPVGTSSPASGSAVASEGAKLR
ncbi:hypothetical protein HYS03_02100 [Candidatus Woesebacteria bacterium]|nr:hypothetical protein [Candidatus Woesebacteria bacterium]QQG47736.1 MAG: hypothetical protein HY044_01445 [Candidatus Woesebacteria bacterium]